ncbi:MAG: putative membrane protein [Planctomycetaceae bacterium]|jgi:uncharacterized membrane protein
MKRLVLWIIDRGVVQTFLTGLFSLLPLVLTLALMSWAGKWLTDHIGPDSVAGQTLRGIGLKFVANEAFATIAGWTIVFVVIWSVGLLIRATARFRLQQAFDSVMNHIPIVRRFYGPLTQVVDLFKKNDQDEMQNMSVVFCTFGDQQGGGFLALRASSKLFHFRDRDCFIVYIPTSPVPMSGGIVFVPTDGVQEVEMEFDELMQIYLSLGVVAGSVVPEKYVRRNESQ